MRWRCLGDANVERTAAILAVTESSLATKKAAVGSGDADPASGVAPAESIRPMPRRLGLPAD